MTTPNEQAPATRSEWLELIREAVRLEIEERGRRTVWAIPRSTFRPQPPAEG